MKKIIIPLFIGFFAAGAIWFTFFNVHYPKQVPLSDTIIVGTSADFKPFTFKDGDDIVGFDIDVVKEVAQRLGKTVEIKDLPFELLMPQLQLGTIHIIAAGMTTTPERAQQVIFTEPYVTDDPLIIVSLVHNLVNEQNLAHKKVIVNQGYTADLQLSKRSDIELMRLPTIADALLALRSGRADAFVTAAHTIKPFIEHHTDVEFAFSPLSQLNENTALALSKKHPQLAQDVQQVIHEMIVDGTIDHLKQAWLQ